MVEPLPQNNQPQVNQGLPSAVGQQSSQQQPFHPMVVGQNYAAPSYPQAPAPSSPQSPAPSHGGGTQNKNIITINPLSLFAMAASLIFLGAFTFLAGFLLGMWLAGSKNPSTAPLPEEVNELLQQQLSSFSTPKDETKDEGDSSSTPKSKRKNLAERVGATVRNEVSKVPLSDVPDFLAPLLKETQDALGKEAEYKAKQITQQAQKLLTPPPKPSPSPRQSTTGATQSSLPLPKSASLPVTTSQKTSPAVSSSPKQEEGAYAIQLGVYAAKENAEAMKQKLEALDYTAYVSEGKSAEGGPLYYLYSGRYNDYATGSEVASQFASQNIVPGAIVVKLSKNGKDGS